MNHRLFLLPLALLIAACSRDAAPPVTPAPQAAPAPARSFSAAAWALPAPDGAAQPDLVALPDGGLLLSWIEKGAKGHSLRFARHGREGWSEPRTIASGTDWFVNWADTPHVQATPDGALWAHWLRKSAAATYAYDVVLSRSGDAGATWSVPVRVNEDGTPTEHGFVSLWPAAHDRLGIAWLDGRNTGGGHGDHGGGMMTLRSATFDAALTRAGETEIDTSTCDCCQTDITPTPRGALLVYRDRTADEIRDIATTRLQGAAWTAPARVHADNWKMPACPVNGPSAASRGEHVTVGWYTATGGVPAVRVARSRDAGDRFGAPLTLDSGAEVLGRVDVTSDADGDWVSWLREDASGQSLWIARIDAAGTAVRERLKVAAVPGRGRGTGVPKLVRDGDSLRAVWTGIVDGRPRLQGATLALR